MEGCKVKKEGDGMLDDMGLSESWDKFAEQRGLRKLSFDTQISISKVLRYCKDLNKNLRIIDLGCGQGDVSHQLKLIGFKNLVGIEISPKLLRYGKAKYPNEFQLVATDGLQVPFKNNSFDIVISVAVIEHVLDQSKYIQEISRIVRPQGYVILVTDCYFYRIQKALGFYGGGPNAFPIDDAPYPPNLLKKFREFNLELFHCDAWGHYKFHHLRIATKGVLAVLFHLLPHPIQSKIKKYLAHPLHTGDYNNSSPVNFMDELEIESKPEITSSYRLNLLTLLKLFYKGESVFYLRKSNGRNK